MQIMRSLSVALIAIAASAANAQFNGPAPLAWRWLSTSSVPSNGSPLVHGDTIYMSSGGRIYAVDRVTGNKKWQFPALDPIPGTFRQPPIIVNGVMVATGDNKIVYSMDPDTGAPKWTYVMSAAPLGQPIQVDKYIVQAQSDNKMVAIDPTSGQSFWKGEGGDPQLYTVLDGLYGQIAASGTSILYFTSANELHSVDITTRKEDAWQRPVRFTQLDAFSQALVYGDNIYVTSGQFLIAINPLTGSPVWQTATGFETAFSPTASAKGIFVVSKDGNAMLYDLTTGMPTPGMPTPVALGSYPATRPSAVGDKFVVPTTSGAIDLLDPSNGAILWSYVVRPMGKMYASKPSSNGQNGGPGGGGPGPGGPGGGGFGGGQGPGGGFGLGGGGGGQGGVRNVNTQEEITEIEASGPAVLDGQTLLVPAKDGSLLAFDKDLGVDLTPPSAKLLFPTPGDQVSGLPPLLLYFRVRDEGSGVNEKTLVIRIDGTPYDYKYKRDGSATVSFSSEGKNKPLSDGRHVITVDVSDWLNNVAHESFSLTIDNSLPAIKLPGQPATNPNGPGGRGGPGGGFGGGKGGGGGD
jgi:outer membrane protein assembly factor BamB